MGHPWHQRTLGDSCQSIRSQSSPCAPRPLDATQPTSLHQLFFKPHAVLRVAPSSAATVTDAALGGSALGGGGAFDGGAGFGDEYDDDDDDAGRVAHRLFAHCWVIRATVLALAACARAVPLPCSSIPPTLWISVPLSVPQAATIMGTASAQKTMREASTAAARPLAMHTATAAGAVMMRGQASQVAATTCCRRRGGWWARTPHTAAPASRCVRAPWGVLTVGGMGSLSAMG